ncbi:MAG: hypothetical protein ABFD69_05835 [Candidatus Sumerlaeia bacterium]
MIDETGQSDAESCVEPPSRTERAVFWLGLACTLLPVLMVIWEYASDRLTTVSVTKYQYFLSVPVGLVFSYGSVMNALRRANLHWYHFTVFVLNLLVCGLTSIEYLIAGIMSLVFMIVMIRGEATTQLVYLFPVFFLAFAFHVSQTFFMHHGRSPVSRVQADMRSMQIAIESYYADHKAYPVSTTDPALRARWKSGSDMPGFMKHRPQGPDDLTMPTAYLYSYPTDPYRLYRDDRTYAYHNHQNKNWILISPGPDCVFDIKPGDLPETMSKLIEGDSTMLAVNTYDPTNGSISHGDVYKYKY